MSKTLQLDDFALTGLAMKWNGDTENDSDRDASAALNFRVFGHTTDPGRFRLEMTVAVRPPEGAGESGWTIDAAIRGDFQIPDGSEEKPNPGFMAYNGATILYGLLRGQIAAATGSFPPGKFMLPTVSIADAMADKAKSRLKAKAAAKPRKPGKPRTKT